jgi:DNA-binding NarL/FixJ family response regulator
VPHVCGYAMSPKKETTVLLEYDHNGFLDEVSGLLIDEYKIVGTARDGRSALDAARESHAEIILFGY